MGWAQERKSHSYRLHLQRRWSSGQTFASMMRLRKKANIQRDDTDMPEYLPESAFLKGRRFND